MHYHERRFEYNIHPRGSEDVEAYYPLPPSRHPRDYSLHEVSPIRNRHSLENPYHESHRYNSMHVDDSLLCQAPPQQDHHYEPRRRNSSSTTGFRKTQDKARGAAYEFPVPPTRKDRVVPHGDAFGAEFEGVSIRRDHPR